MSKCEAVRSTESATRKTELGASGEPLPLVGYRCILHLQPSGSRRGRCCSDVAVRGIWASCNLARAVRTSVRGRPGRPSRRLTLDRHHGGVVHDKALNHLCYREREKEEIATLVTGLGTWRCLAVRAWRMVPRFSPGGPQHRAGSWPWPPRPPTQFPPLLCKPTNNCIIILILSTLVTLALSSSLLTNRPFAATFNAAPFLLLTRLCHGGFRHPSLWEHQRPDRPQCQGSWAYLSHK